MDKAISLTEKFPTAIDVAVTHLEQVINEKLNTVLAGVSANKEQLIQKFQLNDEQVKTALASAKELVEKQNEFTNSVYVKSESNFRSELALLSAKVDLISKTEDDNINANAKAINEKVDDVRIRLTTIESIKKGNNENMAWVITGITVIYSILATIGIITTLLSHHS